MVAGQTKTGCLSASRFGVEIYPHVEPKEEQRDGLVLTALEDFDTGAAGRNISARFLCWLSSNLAASACAIPFLSCM